MIFQSKNIWEEEKKTVTFSVTDKKPGHMYYHQQEG